MRKYIPVKEWNVGVEGGLQRGFAEPPHPWGGPDPGAGGWPRTAMDLQLQLMALWTSRKEPRWLKKMMGQVLMSNGWPAYLRQPIDKVCE